MRAATLILTLMVTIAAAAQEQPQTPGTTGTQTSEKNPDYSRETLLRILRDEPRPERRAVRFRVGAVEFDALGTEWRFVYLPLMLPLSGTRMGVSQQLPDPFALSQTAIASPPRSWSEGSGLVRLVKKLGRSSVSVKGSGRPR